MRKIIALFLIAVGSICLFGAPSGANDNPQVCAGTHVDPPGDPLSVTITAPDGQLISGYCVKAGSLNQGNGPVYVVVDPPSKTVTISHPSGKEISHYTVTFVTPNEPTTTTVAPTTTTTVAPTTTVQEPTTTTVPETTSTTEEPSEQSTTTTTEGADLIPPVVIVGGPLEQLPVTGSSTWPLTGLGVGLILSGVALSAKSRRSLG